VASLRELKPAAELLAAKEDWPALYDCEQLRTNEVPVASATYFEVGNAECGLRRVLCCQVDSAPVLNMMMLPALSPVQAEVSRASGCLQDMYVDFDAAQETAAQVDSVQQWITNEYRYGAMRKRSCGRCLQLARLYIPSLMLTFKHVRRHSGIRDDGLRIFETLNGACTAYFEHVMMPWML